MAKTRRARPSCVGMQSQLSSAHGMQDHEHTHVAPTTALQGVIMFLAFILFSLSWILFPHIFLLFLLFSALAFFLCVCRRRPEGDRITRGASGRNRSQRQESAGLGGTGGETLSRTHQTERDLARVIFSGTSVPRIEWMVIVWT